MGTLRHHHAGERSSGDHHRERAQHGGERRLPGVTLAYSTLNGSGGWNRVPFLPIGNINIDQTYNVTRASPAAFRSARR